MKQKHKTLYVSKRSKYVEDEILDRIIKSSDDIVSEAFIYYKNICRIIKLHLSPADFHNAKRTASIHIRNYIRVKSFSDTHIRIPKDIKPSKLFKAFTKGKGRAKSKIKFENFDLYNNPEATLKNLKNLHLLQVGMRCIELMDISVQDITPYFILYELHKEISEMREAGFSVMRSHNVIDILENLNIDIGVRGAGLDINRDEVKEITGSEPNDNVEPIIQSHAFNMSHYDINNDNAAGKSGSKVEKITSTLVAELIKWNRNINLSPISEILNNCEDHCQDDKTLSLAWCWLERINGQKEIQICIITYGEKSIGENIINKYGIEHDYIKMYKNSNYYTPENLATVLAIQDGISSMDQKQGFRRGLGFMKFLDCANRLSNGKFDFNIISGNTQIMIESRLSNPFIINQNSAGDRVHYFNKNNDFTCLPDNNSVYNIKDRFPGTIISFRMYIDTEVEQKNE